MLRRVTAEVAGRVLRKRHVFGQLEELDVLGGRNVPQIFSAARFATYSLAQPGAAEAEIFHFDGVLAFERADDASDDGAASESAVPDDLSLFFCALERRRSLLGLRDAEGQEKARRQQNVLQQDIALRAARLLSCK